MHRTTLSGHGKKGRFHTHRTTRRDRDHRHPRVDPLPCICSSQERGQEGREHEQHEADWDGGPALLQRLRRHHPRALLLRPHRLAHPEHVRLLLLAGAIPAIHQD